MVSPGDAPARDAAQRVWEALSHVPDPEIPVLTVLDLGIVRAVRVDGAQVEVTITPTYSGCPAMHAIEQDIRRVLAAAGYPDARIHTALSPAWTSAWMSTDGREKLTRYGIAPPGAHALTTVRLHRAEPAAVACPRCGAVSTERLAEFGSTACKALYRCRDCREPFDYFKPI
jgi:ring-1,2-phenylacetyl-CoA epoxidase subunit PaaD